MSRLFAYLSGVVLIAAGIAVLAALRFDAGEMLDALPDASPMPELRRLCRDGEYQQAEVLADAIIAENLPGAAEAAVIRARCREKSGTFWKHGSDILTGFVTGEPKSAAAAGGAIAADMMLFGDLRDLALQGIKKISGGEVDPVLTAFAGVGVATEVIDLIDWLPALFKSWRRAGALTDRFSASFFATMRRSARLGRLDNSAWRMVGDLRAVSVRCGMKRSALLMRHVDSVQELGRFARMAERSPDAAVLLIRSGGADRIKLLARSGEAADLLCRASRKGTRGVTLLRQCRWSVRVGKIVYTGRAGVLLRELAAISPVVRQSMIFSGKLLCALGVLVIAVLQLPRLLRVATRRVRAPKKKKHKKKGGKNRRR